MLVLREQAIRVCYTKQMREGELTTYLKSFVPVGYFLSLYTSLNDCAYPPQTIKT